MAGDQNRTTQPQAYTFDYPQEIHALLSSYPKAGEGLFFVKVPWQSARSNLSFECYGPAWEKYKDLPEARTHVEASVLRTLESGSSRAVRSKYADMRFIVIYFPNAMNSKRPIDMAFTFDHEAGHQLVPSGFLVNDEKLVGESAADAFACLRCLQRFGRDSGIKILRDLYTQRLFHPLSKHAKDDWGHLTAAVLLQIIKDAPGKAFENMSPEETISAAEDYAQKFSPSGDYAKNEWKRMNAIVQAKDSSPGKSTANIQHEAIQAPLQSAVRQHRRAGHGPVRILLLILFVGFSLGLFIYFIYCAIANPALLLYL